MVISSTFVDGQGCFKVRVAIRTDASYEIGSGHLMRCIALADELQKSGYEILFISSNREQNWIKLIREKNYECATIVTSFEKNRRNTRAMKSNRHRVASNDIDWQKDSREVKEILKYRTTDWLIVDHYGIDWRWETSMRNHVTRIMVIDDLADRKHDCDLLLDFVYGRQADDYQHLVTQDCQLLLGTKYTLLRSEFLDWQRFALHRRRNAKRIQKILISLGGVDHDNLTGTVLRLLNQVDWILDTQIHVILGPGFRGQPEIETIITNPRIKATLEWSVNDMARRIANADFGIGALGVSTWERFCLGLPSINIIAEPNQFNLATRLEKLHIAGIIFSEFIERELLPNLYRMTSDEGLYAQISDDISSLVDGRGAYRVARQLNK